VAVRTRLTRTMPRSLTVRSSREKEVVAETAAKLVDGGMRVGIGTGTTIARLLPLLPARGVVYVATSPGTEAAAGRLGLNVQPFEVPDRLDLAFDSADQVGPTGWLVKGRGRAHTREKVVAAAAERFVVLVSSNKLVPQLTAPVPLELLAFGVEATLRSLGPARLRGGPTSPDGGLIADYDGPIGDPTALADRLSNTPGVIEHGLFAPQLVSEILVGDLTEVRRLRPSAGGLFQGVS
jgi:ribose 5-phosphate isomerase A